MAARLLRDEGVRVVLATVLMQQNFFEHRQLSDLADSLGVLSVVSPIIYPKNNGDSSPLGYRLESEEIKQAYAYYFEKDRETFEKALKSFELAKTT